MRLKKKTLWIIDEVIMPPVLITPLVAKYKRAAIKKIKFPL